MSVYICVCPRGRDASAITKDLLVKQKLAPARRTLSPWQAPLHYTPPRSLSSGLGQWPLCLSLVDPVILIHMFLPFNSPLKCLFSSGSCLDLSLPLSPHLPHYVPPQQLSVSVGNGTGKIWRKKKKPEIRSTGTLICKMTGNHLSHTVSIHTAGVAQLRVCTFYCHLYTVVLLFIYLNLFVQIHSAHV